MSANPFIITISGDLGSGKSVLAERLAKHYDANRYSTGTAQRQLAAEMGITTLELNQRAETDKSIDDKIDGVFKSLAKTDVNLIVDSRLAWHFLPSSFRIKLEVAPQIAADRISKDNTRIGEGDTSPNVILQSILDRRASEKERFKRYYKVDITANKNFDLVVNTYGVAPGDIAAKVIESVDKWRESAAFHSYWMAPSIININRQPSAPLLDGEAHPVIRHDGADVYAIRGHNLITQAIANKTSLIEVCEH